MDMVKVKVLNSEDLFQDVWVNPTMIAAVMASPRSGLVKIVMADGTQVEVEYTLDDLLARLGLVL